MKKLFSLVALTLASFGALAQGTINFANGAGGSPPVNAPISDTDGTTKLAGAGFIAQLYGGAVGTAWDSLGAVTPTAVFATGLNAGYFFGGPIAVTGVAGGSAAAAQVRVWNSAFASWDAAWAAYQAGNPTAKVGVSGWNGTGLPTTTLTTPPLGGGVNTTPNLIGLTSFHLYSVPEPSTIALGVLGTAALLLRRRK